mgnify:CR=1 FL=1
MLPTALGMSLNQVSSLLDQLMAYYLVAPGAASAAVVLDRGRGPTLVVARNNAPLLIFRRADEPAAGDHQR